MSPELTELLNEMEIRVVPVHAYRAPLTTMAVSTMERILRQRGYANAKLTLMSIAETERNRRELVEPTILAISDLVAAYPQWADRASKWLEAFDRIDLGQLRAFAKRNRGAVKVRDGLCTMMFGFLHSVMEPPTEKAEPAKREPAQPRPPRSKRALNAATAA